MFSYEILEDDGVIVLATTGQMAVEDYQVFAPKFYAVVRSQGIRRILLDWREFRGWSSKEAPTITFFSWMEGRPLFDRIAVVFHDGVRNEVEKFQVTEGVEEPERAEHGGRHHLADRDDTTLRQAICVGAADRAE